MYVNNLYNQNYIKKEMKNNKEIVFFDKNINRKSEIVRKSLQYFKNKNIPMPSVIEISDSGVCNRKCSFCPRSNPEWIEKFDNTQFIKKELHEKKKKNRPQQRQKRLIGQFI